MFDELANARSLWETKEIKSYTITIQEVDCFCFHALHYGPIRNTVRKGQIQNSVYIGPKRDGWYKNRRVRQSTSLKATVEDLFRYAESTMNHNDHQHIELEFHAEYGFPLVIGHDNPRMEDEQSKIVVSDFRVNQ